MKKPPAKKAPHAAKGHHPAPHHHHHQAKGKGGGPVMHAPHIKAKGPGGKGAGKTKRPHPKHHPKPHPKRQLSAGDVACCAAEALAASLRLAGRPVSDEDVLALHWLAGGDEDSGATISATLKAASWHGLAGVRPVTIRNVNSSPVPGSVLGVTLPGGPHAVTADPSGLVWSWGELHDLAGLGAGPVEEAWLVTW